MEDKEKGKERPKHSDEQGFSEWLASNLVFFKTKMDSPLFEILLERCTARYSELLSLNGMEERNVCVVLQRMRNVFQNDLKERKKFDELITFQLLEKIRMCSLLDIALLYDEYARLLREDYNVHPKTPRLCSIFNNKTC